MCYNQVYSSFEFFISFYFVFIFIFQFQFSFNLFLKQVLQFSLVFSFQKCLVLVEFLLILVSVSSPWCQPGWFMLPGSWTDWQCNTPQEGEEGT